MGIRNTISSKGFVSYKNDGEDDLNTLEITTDITAEVVLKGQRNNIVEITSDTSLSVESSSIVLVDATTGLVTITLPDIASTDGYFLKIKKIDTTSSNVKIIGFNDQLIDNDSQKIITLAYTTLTFVSKNGKWWIV